MKTLKRILLALALAGVCLAMAACEDPYLEHTHVFNTAKQPDVQIGTPYDYNVMGEPYHIRPVDCGVRADEYTGRECIVCDCTIYTLTRRNVEQPHRPWDSWVTLKEATCTRAGTEGRLCGWCQAALETRAVPALGHAGKAVDAVAATCTQAGQTAGTKCARCGEVLSGCEAIPALGHDAETVPAVAATCTQPGNARGKRCKRCGEVLSGCEAVPALGHDPREVLAVAATCTGDGMARGSRCARCGETLSGCEVVPALGHNWNRTYTVTSATSIRGGARLYFQGSAKCYRCGAQVTSEATFGTVVEVPMALHGGTIKVKGSFRQEPFGHGGTTTYSITLPGDHQRVVWHEAVEPTCTQPGRAAEVGCWVCSETLEAAVERPALGHDWGEWTRTTEPTCAAAGEESHTCARCNATEAQAVAALPHTVVTDPAVEPTCTQSGWTEGSHCSVCGAVLVPQYGLMSMGHQVVVDPRVEPTCDDNGLTEGARCSVCGEVLQAQKDIPRLGHEMVKVEAVPATCTQAGNRAYMKCRRCGGCLATDTPMQQYSDVTLLTPEDFAIPIDPSAHDLDDPTEMIFPTCVQPGRESYWACKRCGKWFQDRECTRETDAERVVMPADPNAHDWGDWAQAAAPTCTEAGSEARACRREGCGATETREIPALGHTEVIDAAVAATCTEPGKTEGRHCSVCGEVLAEQETVPALGHTGGTATCTAHAICDRCGEEYGELAAHQYAEPPEGKYWERVETVDGKRYSVYGHYLICSVCETAQIEVEDGREEILEDDPPLEPVTPIE